MEGEYGLRKTHPKFIFVEIRFVIADAKIRIGEHKAKDKGNAEAVGQNDARPKKLMRSGPATQTAFACANSSAVPRSAAGPRCRHQQRLIPAAICGGEEHR